MALVGTADDGCELAAAAAADVGSVRDAGVVLCTRDALYDSFSILDFIKINYITTRNNC